MKFWRPLEGASSNAGHSKAKYAEVKFTHVNEKLSQAKVSTKPFTAQIIEKQIINV